MQINSLTFLYLFLPAALLIFNLVPGKFKTTALAFISGIFIAFSGIREFLIITCDISVLYFLSEAMLKNSSSSGRKKIFSAAVFINIGVIIFSSIQNPTSAWFSNFSLMVISFTAIGYFVDLYKGETEAIRSLPDFVVFLAFFGKLGRGPLVRAKDFVLLPGFEKFSLSETGTGLYLFIRGLAKYVVLSLPLSELHEKILAANSEEISVFGAWLGMVVFSMMIFFNLSGFCDIARGLGRCFGIELPKNFYFPFQSPSVSDFLDRFNMTVTAFFRHYVYDVLRNDKNSRPQFIVNTILISMLCGIWFGIKMNFIFWGLYIAAFIIIEEFFLHRILEKIPHFFARVYTFAVTMFSMVIFSASDIGSILKSYKAMFGIDAVILTDSISYIVSQNILILLLGAFFLISAFSMFVRYLSKKAPFAYSLFAVLESAVLLVLISAELL